jgi:hypothetical protein
MIRYQNQDYCFWRDTYESGDDYIRQHVQRLSEQESEQDFARRLETTPSPSHAREVADRVLNALQERLRVSVRYGKLVESVESKQGVAGDGSSTNQFAVTLAKEMLITGKVAVLIANAREIETSADSLRSQPFCKLIRAEQLIDVQPSAAGSESAFSVVELELRDKEVFRFWIDENGQVFAKLLPNGEPVDMQTTVIPIAIAHHPSLIARVARTQKALTNLLSVMASNSPDLLTTFLARQRDAHVVGSYLQGSFGDATIGRQRGLWYEKNLNQPAFVSPPSGPMTEARQLADALILDIERLAGLSGDTDNERKQSLANVVGALGDNLFNLERQIWGHLARYTGINDTPVIRPPVTWFAQSESERLTDVAKRFEIAQQFYGRPGMEAAGTDAVEQALAGRSSQEIQAAVESVKKARCLASDLPTIVRAYEARGLDTATLTDTFGCLPVVATDAKAEAHERTVELAQAAAAAQATKSADSVDTLRDGALAEKRLSQAEGNGTTRGEGR